MKIPGVSVQLASRGWKFGMFRQREREGAANGTTEERFVSVSDDVDDDESPGGHDDRMRR